jgi:hypothetical protein
MWEDALCMPKKLKLVPSIVVAPIYHPPVILIATQTISSIKATPLHSHASPHPSFDVDNIVHATIDVSSKKLVQSSAPPTSDSSSLSELFMVRSFIDEFLCIMNGIDFMHFCLNFML